MFVFDTQFVHMLVLNGNKNVHSRYEIFDFVLLETEELDSQKVRDDDEDDEELKQYCALMSSKVDDEENESADECEDEEEGNSDEHLLVCTVIYFYQLNQMFLSKSRYRINCEIN